jgi:hypothetical protein
MATASSHIGWRFYNYLTKAVLAPSATIRKASNTITLSKYAEAIMISYIHNERCYHHLDDAILEVA